VRSIELHIVPNLAALIPAGHHAANLFFEQLEDAAIGITPADEAPRDHASNSVARPAQSRHELSGLFRPCGDAACSGGTIAPTLQDGDDDRGRYVVNSCASLDETSGETHVGLGGRWCGRRFRLAPSGSVLGDISQTRLRRSSWASVASTTRPTIPIVSGPHRPMVSCAVWW